MYGAKLTSCICPKCERKHKLKIRWTGDGMPKKYCSQCKALLHCGMDIDFGGGSRSTCRKKSNHISGIST